MNGVSDEMLMAFVDGELDDASAVAISQAIETDPDVARRVAVFETSRNAVIAAFAGIMAEPAPKRLVDAIMQDGGRASSEAENESSSGATSNVVPLARRPQPVPSRFLSGAPYALPLAACLALAVGLGSGVWIGQNGAGPQGGLFAPGGSLTAALSTQPSGPESAVEVDGLASTLSVLGSYSIEGGLCRSFRVENAERALRGLACDRGEGFAVDVAVASGGSDASGFAPASDGAAESLDVYLDTLEAQGPLSPEEEAERLRR